MSGHKNKAKIRVQIKAILAGIPQTVRKQSETSIYAALHPLSQVQTAKHIAAYLAMPDELSLDTWIIQNLAHKTIYLPRFNSKKNEYELAQIKSMNSNIISGRFHIREPNRDCPSISIREARKKIDLWLIPGRAFDKSGNRLGRGKGIYDHFLKNAAGYKIGIAFDSQISEHPLPTTPSDIKVDHLLTPTQNISIN